MTDALYAAGRVAVLSQKLWQREKFFRMAECRSFEEGLGMLSETSYGGYNPSYGSDYEKALQKELSDSVAFLKENSSDDKVTECFLAKYDYLNAKIMMKSKYMRRSPENTYDVGLIDRDKLWSAVSSDDYRSLPDAFQRALNKIDFEFARGNRSPATVDITLDREMFAERAVNAKKIKAESIRRYFAVETDGVNLLTLARAKRSNMGEREYFELIADGGKTDKTIFSAAFKADAKDIAGFFSDTPYAEVAVKLSEALLKQQPFAEAEELLFEMKRSILAANKNNLTVEPVVCYYLAKVTETDNIRMILICLKNNVGKEEIKERIKRLYV